MKKLEEKDMELLQRKRVIYLLEHEKKPTPKAEDVVKEIAKDMKVGEELIKLRHIYPHYGVEKAKIIAHIYKTKEALKRFEEINKKKKKIETKKEEKKVEVKESGEKASEKQKSK